jgi:hypothetical protein
MAGSRGSYSLVDMAIYPVLFNQYLRYFIPDWTREWNGSSRLRLFGAQHGSTSAAR